jgi:hypothetical protein
MAITTNNTITIEHPEIPYDKYLVYMSVSPIVNYENTDVEAALSLRLVPYRILPNGQIDKNEAAAYNESCGNVFEKSQEDAVLGQAAMALMSLIQDFVDGRNA